jgi:hypothetical protein
VIETTAAVNSFQNLLIALAPTARLASTGTECKSGRHVTEVNVNKLSILLSK